MQALCVNLCVFCVKVSGVCLVERSLRRSFPRETSTCSFQHGDGKQHTDEPRGPGPFYFFGGANGLKM